MKKRSSEAAEATYAEKRHRALQAAELGIIESVSLQNFMCHDNLKFEFEPHVNFIIGLNGSGKSAILTGIILALGGRSSSTGRFPNIKGFIRNGKKTAVISVTLKNCGASSYKPDEYGNRIIVERLLNADGISTYKMRSEEGQVISTSKEELSNILTIMDIHVENPITVLTQDTSRTFLISKNANKDKLYQLFYEGTGLQKLQENYKEASKLREDAMLDLENKKAALPEMEKELQRWENLMNHAERMNDLKIEFLWAIAIELEKKLWEVEQKHEEVQNEITKVKKEMEKAEAEYSKVSEDLKKHIVDQKDIEKEINSRSIALTELKFQEQNIAKDYREYRGTFDRYKRENERLCSVIEHSQNVLNEALQKNKDDIDAEQRKREEEMQKLEMRLSEIESELDAKSKMWNACLGEKENLEQRRIKLLAEKGDAHRQKANVENELRHLKNSMDNKDAFGPEMKNILRKISCCSEFIKPPKGPFGLYLEILNQKWSFALEVCLSDKLLKAFCCDNSQDAKLLGGILSEHFPKSNMPSVIVSKYLSMMHNVAPYRAKSSYSTVLDMLKIKDPVIGNCLIDLAKIENIILIDNTEAAIDLMMNTPPELCIAAFLENGDQILPKPYRYYSCNKRRSSCLLRSFCQDDIKEKEEELQVINDQISSKTRDIAALEEKFMKLSADHKSCGDSIVKLKVKLNQLKQKLNDKKKIEEPKDMTDMQSELDHLLEEKEKIEDKIKEYEARISKQGAELEIIKKKRDTETAILLKKQQEYQHLISRKQECQKQSDFLKTKMLKYEEALITLKEKVEEYAKDVSEAKKATEIAMKNAEKFSARINTEKSSETLKKLLDETSKALEEASKCEKENIEEKYEEKRAKFEKAKSELKHIESYIIRIGEMMEKRSRKFKVVLKQTKLCLSLSFATYLNSNKFTGELSFDDEKRTLTIVAAPKDEQSKKHDYTCYALSGGERSFVTICFLLSLWERIEMPFRILDEYDVFMDSEKRHLSVNLLTKTAEEKKDVQFIFLSPLELPMMKDSPYIKVHKMPAPKRKTEM